MNLKKINSLNFDDLLDDFYHPNPNLNRKAYKDMIAFWPKESLEFLISNLSTDDINLRRKSIKALGEFGPDILSPIGNIYNANSDRLIKTSCLKVFLNVASRIDAKPFPSEIIELLKSSLLNENPEMILIVILIFRQLGSQGIPILIEIAKSQNILMAKAAITSLEEIDDPLAKNCLKEIFKNPLKDKLLD